MTDEGILKTDSVM